MSVVTVLFGEGYVRTKELDLGLKIVLNDDIK